MKRLASYLIATALMAFTFTSCEDVPSPFGQILAPDSGEKIVVDPAGSGTEADPYNVAGVLEYVVGLGADVQSSQQVYIKGIVSEVQDVDVTGSYGNATYYISDDAEGKANKFMIYRGFGLGGKKFNEGATPVKAGDAVIIKSKVVNYKGNTPETVSNDCIIVELNGVKDGGSGGGDTPQPTSNAKGTGTEADPYNPAGANKYISSLAADTESANDIYIKGKIVKYANNGEFNAQYGNASFYISEDGKESSEQFYVFRTLYLGNVKYTEGATPKVGDEVVICGKVVNYKGNTPETVANKSYIFSLNGQTTPSGGGSDTPPSSAGGSGTLADPYNAAGANSYVSSLAADTETTTDIYIKGKIVKYANNGEFSTQYGNASFYISDDGKESSEQFYVFRTLYLGNVKYTEGVTPKVGDEVIICGKVVNYKGNTPETAANKSYIYSLNGKTSADGGGGSDQSSGGGTSTLVNGNFETWADGLPTGWKSASTASSATLVQSTDVHGGNYSCIIKGDTGNNKRLGSQELKLAAGTYTFSFWVKPTTSNVAQVRPGYVPVDSDNKAGSYKYGDYATLTSGWQQVSYEFTLDAETTVCLVVMNPKASSYSSGEDVIIDDASLTKK